MRLKLAPHYLPGGEDDSRAWLPLRPAVAKFVFKFELAASAPPGVLCVGKPEDDFLGRHVVLSGDAVALAREYAATLFAPLVKQYPRIDAWEGPNEIVIAPNEIDRMKWFTAFLAEFAKQMQALGKRAVIGAWAVGTPEFNLWQYYGPALQACRDYQAILSRHSYGPLNQWYSFRHRLDELEFQKLGFSHTPVIISECGADGLGQPGWATWRRMWNNDVASYWNEYLLPFTQELEKDPYVLGAALFTVGSGFKWADFDVAGMGLIPYVANYAQTLPPDTPPTPTPPAPDEMPFVGFYRVKIQQELNARLFPWTSDDEPPIMRKLAPGEEIKIYGIYLPEGMTYGWGSLSPASNQWVNMMYLERVA